MKLGTKSVLFGYHCFLIHWIFVAIGWLKLYGVRRVEIGTRTYHGSFGATISKVVFTSIFDVRLWVAFVIHDLGYWGKPNMDGIEGELHPIWAAEKMDAWFGEPWGDFTRYHSRFLAKKEGAKPSPLCYADKLAICYLPDWLYLTMIHETGEVYEYMANAKKLIGADPRITYEDSKVWLRDVKTYVWKWVEKHKDGRVDTWTPDYGSDKRETVTDSGVFK